MRILALDASGARCSVALLVDDAVVAQHHAEGGRGQSVHLPLMVRQCLEADADADADAPGALGAAPVVAVTVGPGSFTGLRAALSLAHGLALVDGAQPVGVGVAEAVLEAWTHVVPPHAVGVPVWVALQARRGRVFVVRAGVAQSFAEDDIPVPQSPVVVIGDAAQDVAARLTACGATIVATHVCLPWARDVARVAARRLRGEIPPLVAQPLYVEPPEAKLPSSRPAAARA